MGTQLRVGVIGAGAIGATLCRALCDGTVNAELSGVVEVDAARRQALAAELGRDLPPLTVEALAAASDLVVEAVSKALAPDLLAACLRAGADVLTMSVSALLERGDLLDLARETGRRIHVPTGAIAGLDAIRAAAVAGLDEVTLTTTKPPAGLLGAPWVVEHGLDLAGLAEPTVLFEGPAQEAVKAFPANVNVAAALALAGIGPDRTTVRVVCDPTSGSNRHEITARGASGALRLAVDNVPSPQNPKTSYLAALSAIALLQRLTSPLVVGS